MRRLLNILGICLLIVIISGSTELPASEKKVIRRDWNRKDVTGYSDAFSYDSCVTCTGFNIATWRFEDGVGTPDWQGWTRSGNAAFQDTFWHVDYSDLQVTGTKAWVLGAGEGYGNNWDQSIVLQPGQSYTGTVRISFLARLDTEPGFDYLAVEANSGLGFFEIARMSGHIADSIVVLEFDNETWLESIRLRFRSDESVSPEDDPGPWMYGGNLSIDSIEVWLADTLFDYEDCEDTSVAIYDRQTDSDLNGFYWTAECDTIGYLDDLYSSLQFYIQDHDPCEYISTSVVAFGDPDEPDPEYPGAFDTPFCDGSGKCQDEMVVSPVIDIRYYSEPGTCSNDMTIPGDHEFDRDIKLYFRVYRDLPLENLVFYYWKVRSIVDGNPGPWRDRGYLYYAGSSGLRSAGGRYDGRDWFVSENDIGDLVESDSVQVAVGVVDMSGAWFGDFDPVTEHTPAPWFDEVSLRRCSSPGINPTGPVFGYREIDLFQDAFPSSAGDIESFVRADMAADVNGYNAGIVPGDSIVISCDALVKGLGTHENIYGPARVYMHVRCSYIAEDGLKAARIYGSSLEGDYGSYISDDGSEWTVFIADSARSGDHPPEPDRYCFDLNDSLLTRGYMVEYYFLAIDKSGDSNTLPENAGSTGAYPYRGGSNYFEFTCLPTGSTDILYVDDFDGRGCLQGAAQVCWEAAFDAVLDDDLFPDRFDINGPSSLVSNGLASRITYQQLCAFYNWIVWDSGNLRYGTVTDGSSCRDKCDDMTLLNEWASNETEPCGIWFAGDNIARESKGMYNLDGITVLDSYFSESDDPSPDLTSYESGYFPDTLFTLAGGCPVLNDFDVFDKGASTGPDNFELKYDHEADTLLYAAYREDSVNGNGHSVKKFWTGFSLLYLGDNGQKASAARNRLLDAVLGWWDGHAPKEDITGGDIPPLYRNFLDQNFPNPFNPRTTIRFGLRSRGPVGLRIYDVSGRLVRTLVDSELEAGPHRVVWDGRNNGGSQVASGVYFCRLATGEYKKSRKIVLFK